MNTFRAAVCALLFAGAASAHPVVLEEVATLSPPDPSWRYLGSRGVAIDGDFALAYATRSVPDPYDESGFHIDLAAFIYQRSGTAWNYTGQLGPVGLLHDRSSPGLAMKGGIAVVDFGGGAHVFERVGTTWTEAVLPAGVNIQGRDIEIDSGRILASHEECNPTAAVLRKINGQWAVEGELEGWSNNCDYAPRTNQQDIQGEFAVVHEPETDGDHVPPRVRQYRRNENGIGWREFGGFENGKLGENHQPDIAMSGPYIAVTGTRERGTRIAYRATDAAEPAYAFSPVGLQAPDSYLQPTAWSTDTIERVGSLFAQRNYSFDRKAYVINLFRVNDDEAHTNTLVATLQSKSGLSLGDRLDASGNYVIVNDGDVSGTTDGGKVRIYRLPASFEQPDVQVHDFEAASAGAAWQPTAGSSFSTVVARTTHVYRQASTAGNPSSYLPTSTARNQAIQSELIVRAFDGAQAWAGLTTRRSGDGDYYYVALRNSGVVELGRRVGGVSTTLATAPATVTPGRKYRLRLESMATTHSVYLDDNFVLAARDSALTQGDAGVIMNRAAVDYDNVIVTPGPFATIYKTYFSTPATSAWVTSQGQWQTVGGAFRQSNSAGYGRAIIGARTDDQVMQARIRPLSFAGADTWVGLMARYHDDRNHLFVTLRSRGVIALWRRTNGAITQLATRSFPVTAGTWYRVRVEVVNDLTRVFVDNQLQLSSSADPGPSVPGYSDSKGQVGLITYKATADFDDVSWGS